MIPRLGLNTWARVLTMPTVTGTIHDSEGSVRAVDLVFSPTFNHVVSGSALVTKTHPKTASVSADGTFSIDLVAGSYDVAIGETEINITVPGGGGDIKDLIN